MSAFICCFPFSSLSGERSYKRYSIKKRTSKNPERIKVLRLKFVSYTTFVNDAGVAIFSLTMISLGFFFFSE